MLLILKFDHWESCDREEYKIGARCVCMTVEQMMIAKVMLMTTERDEKKYILKL